MEIRAVLHFSVSQLIVSSHWCVDPWFGMVGMGGKERDEVDNEGLGLREEEESRLPSPSPGARNGIER